MTQDILELPLEEIQKRLMNIDADKQALQSALKIKQQQGKRDFVQEVRDLILSKGYDLAEIVDLLIPKKRGGGASRQEAGAYVRYVDPDNPKNVYKRGVLPRWMKDQMIANGLDPKIKANRETFKEKYLTKTEG